MSFTFQQKWFEIFQILHLIWELNWQMSSHKPASLAFRRSPLLSLSRATEVASLPTGTKATVNCPVSFGASLIYATDTHTRPFLLAVYARLVERWHTRVCWGHLIISADIYFAVIQYQSTALSEMAAQLINCCSSQHCAKGCAHRLSPSP